MKSIVKQIANLCAVSRFRQAIQAATTQFDPLKIKEPDLDEICASLQNPLFSILHLHCLIKALKILPQVNESRWDIWIGRASEFLANINPEFIHNLQPIFKVSVLYDETICKVSGINLGYAKRALWVFLRIIENLQFTQITPVHASICKFALITRHLLPAFSVINATPIRFNKNRTNITAQQICLYFYYAGSINLILKYSDSAVRFYQLAISVPCSQAYSVCVQSFKKLILIHLIQFGSIYKPPICVSKILTQSFKSHALEYTIIALKFNQVLSGLQSLSDFMGLIREKHKIWENDQNYGLINRLQFALVQHRIKRLTQTYTSMSFEKLIEATECKNAVNTLEKMATQGGLEVRINHQEHVVTFQDKTEEIDIEMLKTQCLDVSNQIREIQQGIEGCKLDVRCIIDNLRMNN